MQLCEKEPRSGEGRVQHTALERKIMSGDGEPEASKNVIHFPLLHDAWGFPFVSTAMVRKVSIGV